MFEKVKRFFSKSKKFKQQNEEQTIFFQDMEGKTFALRTLPNANNTLLHLISTNKDFHLILDKELCKILGSILLNYSEKDNIDAVLSALKEENNG